VQSRFVVVLRGGSGAEKAVEVVAHDAALILLGESVELC
jgi:hypothetical protein